MEIKDIVQKAHDNAVKHGFWDPPLPFGTAIALIHRERSVTPNAGNANNARNVNTDGSLNNNNAYNGNNGVRPDLVENGTD